MPGPCDHTPKTQVAGLAYTIGITGIVLLVTGCGGVPWPDKALIQPFEVLELVVSREAEWNGDIMVPSTWRAYCKAAMARLVSRVNGT
ncbi:uncharacterized protein DSM5745_06438 [Aspergillus mulundensis]|uniref:Uncharacterized protein n=1 Tax=Aspergillus mulundensis TaxID=1810919 RepID=A0A3D8RR69_9EURO|nr:hypothetical protein DSM5745_06438 [Aspergillus mulundensis]RDW76446.1 hypothetical protein DSM5745_06438 [Aspergillus mulundensis]